LAGISLGLSTLLVLGAFMVVWLAPRDAASANAQNAQNPPAANQGQADADSSEITVRGSGIVHARPDALVVQVGVNMQADTVKEAQDKASSAIAAMTDRIKAAGIEESDYRTIQYTIEPVMDYGTADKNGIAQAPRLIGFRVINMIEITFKNVAEAPAVLDQLVAAGANTVYNVGYIISDPERLYNDAYDKAVRDAEARGTRLAALSGMELGRVISVTEASANIPGPVYDKGPSMGGGAGPFYPGQQSVSVDVIVTYEAAAK
jgi:uncharacterized protein YggE